jgi:hypothetical protein
MLPVQIGDDAEEAEEAERSGDPSRQEIGGHPIAHQNPDGFGLHCMLMNGRPCCAVMCCAVLSSLRRCRDERRHPSPRSDAEHSIS